MAAAGAFERALDALLTGEPLDGALGPRPDDDPALDTLRVLSAIGHASRAVIFGDGVSPRDITRWGHLEIREEIGRGTSGTVYRAWDTRLAREVALKLFDPDSASADAAIEEGRLLARLRHPHIVSVYGADTVDGIPGLWMEFVQGDSLDDVVARDGVMGVEEALLVGIDLAGALAAVHAAGMLHRDVKARNVVRQRGGRLVLMDFGAGHRASEGPVAANGAGTPLYMAPEVLAGAPASVQSDIYGLGVLLHHLLTGRYPVTAENLAGLQEAHRAGRPRRLAEARPDIPAVVGAAIDCACTPDPGVRHGSAQELETALEDALGALIAERVRVVPTTVRRWRRWRRGVTMGVAALAALALIVFAGWDTSPGRAARRAAGLPVPPRSPLYFTLEGGVGVLAGDDLRVLGGSSPGATALAVSERDGIRIMAGAPPWVGNVRLRLDGTPERAAPSGEGLCCMSDGTTDGQYNYTLRQDSTLLDAIGSRQLAPPAVYRHRLDWSGGEPLFELSAPAADVTSTLYHGIAYDDRARALWVTRFAADGAAHAERWSLDGRRDATIDLPAYASGIAVDPADGTLWVLRHSADEARLRFYNLTTAGVMLGTLDIARPMAGSAGGLEFAWPASR